jgi:hypothetical protein
MSALRALARAIRPVTDHLDRWIQSKLAQAAQVTINLIHRLQEFFQQLREFIIRWSAS